MSTSYTSHSYFFFRPPRYYTFDGHTQKLEDCGILELRNVLDVVFPSHSALTTSLEGLGEKYYKGHVELCKVLDTAYNFTGKYSPQNDFLALSLGSVDTEDVWCLDHRGVLTLSLTKETYHQLGLVGEKLSKKSDERFVVQINLYDHNSKLFARAKEAFRKWDERRSSGGIGPWEVLSRGSSVSFEAQAEVTSNPHHTTLPDIYVPQFDLTSPQLSSTAVDEAEEAAEDWHERVLEIFEWVGMSCIGSERLKANDRANPYVAVYEPLSPNVVGDVLHFRWRGFLTPAFVQSVIKAIVDSLSEESSNGNENSPPDFAAITANMYPNTPISFISSEAFAEGVKTEVRHKRSAKGVHCWSVVVKPSGGGKSDWVLAITESIV
ncbi:hypothetical protein M0805_009891 [Coniferiporia weirii]|nr:hypothetical protein M0805_009891 [Coniferiporia weirii]